METGKEILWKNYIKELRPMIAHLVKTINYKQLLIEDDIDDILQESIIVLYEKSLDPTFNLEVKGSTFIYKVAKYKIYEKLRNINKYPLSFKDIFDEFESYEELYDFEEDLNKEDRIKILNDCIELLKDKQKEILIKFYYEKLSMRDIATIFNSTEDSIKTLKNRAKNSVKDCVTLKSN